MKIFPPNSHLTFMHKLFIFAGLPLTQYTLTKFFIVTSFDCAWVIDTCDVKNQGECNFMKILDAENFSKFYWILELIKNFLQSPLPCIQ